MGYPEQHLKQVSTKPPPKLKAGKAMELGMCFILKTKPYHPSSEVWGSHPLASLAVERRMELVPRSLMASPARSSSCMNQPLAGHQSVVQRGQQILQGQASTPLLLEPQREPQAVTEPKTGSQRISWLRTRFSRTGILSSGHPLFESSSRAIIVNPELIREAHGTLPP